MRDVLSELQRWHSSGEQIALATLVDTHGASPRPAGARLACTRSGRMIGSVSGGCVENDVVHRAMQVLDENRSVVQRYGIDDEVSVAVGLSCGGEIDVLIEPFRLDAAWQSASQAIVDRIPVALCVALAPDALVGRHLAVHEDGRAVGGIDSRVDARLVGIAQEMLLDGGQRIVEVACENGPARVFIEAIPPEPRLFIVGATHTATALCRLAVQLGFHVSVVDPRTPFATRERFPDAHELLLEWPDVVLDAAGLDARCHVLTLTHDLKFDVPTLARALRSEVRYIGALGSRKTHERRLVRLREQGFEDADLARIHTPIGLDIGARTPEEIALAILAEIVAVRRGRDGRPLRGKPGRIHAGPGAVDD
jgi:xanthine dehydrogenase accessory factor